MSGLRGRLAVGDKVVRVTRIGNGIDKRTPCTVVDIGARGVQVRYDETRETKWAHVSEFELVEPAKGRRATRLAVDDGEAPAEIVVAAEEAPMAAPPATPVAPTDALARLEASGVDLLALWKDIGAGLTERRRRAVTEADEAVTQAEADVRAAEQLLADARRTLAGAKAHAEDTRRELAQVEREMGVVR